MKGFVAGTCGTCGREQAVPFTGLTFTPMPTENPAVFEAVGSFRVRDEDKLCLACGGEVDTSAGGLVTGLEDEPGDGHDIITP